MDNNTNPVSADLNGDNISGKALNCNFPVTSSPGTSVHQSVAISGSGVISESAGIGYFRQRFT